MRAPLRVILTRVPEDNAILRNLLSEVDPSKVEVVDLPCLKIEHLPISPAVFTQLEQQSFEAVVFVSKPAVRALLDYRPEIRVPKGHWADSETKAESDSDADLEARADKNKSAAWGLDSGSDRDSGSDGDSGRDSDSKSGGESSSSLADDVDLASKTSDSERRSSSVSERAKRLSKAEINANPQQAILPNPPIVVGIGIGTRQEIEQRGWKVTGVPTEPRAEIAVQELDRLLPGSGAVLHVRGDIGASLIQDALRRQGRKVVDTVVYRNTAPDTPPPPPDRRPTLLVATSPSVFRRATALIPSPRSLEVLAIGETTARVSREAELPTHLAPESSPEGLAAGILRWIREQDSH